MKISHIIFYSNHTNKTKSRTIIDLYLRALRICRRQYLLYEEKYIENLFKLLENLNCFLDVIQRGKLLKIMRIENKMYNNIKLDNS